MRLRVVCGLSGTIAILTPTMRLRSVDFPALCRPMREAKPARGIAGSAPLDRRLLQQPEAHLVDAAALGLEDFDLHAVELERFADLRHASDARQHVTADGL